MMEVMASQMSAILLGHSGENGAVRVAFDLTAFQKAFPGGQPLLLRGHDRLSRTADG